MSVENLVTTAVKAVEEVPLRELGPVLAAIMNRVIAHRDEHSGFVPLEVLPLILGIAGQYTCLETIPRVVDENGVAGFLLRQRGSQEQGWQGEFNIPGVAITITPGKDMMDAAQSRLEREIDFISADEWKPLRQSLVPLGVEAHTERERNTTCITVVRALDIPIELYRQIEPSLSEKWKYFPAALNNLTGVVDHHQRTLAWANNPERLDFEFVDLRD